MAPWIWADGEGVYREEPLTMAACTRVLIESRKTRPNGVAG